MPTTPLSIQDSASLAIRIVRQTPHLSLRDWTAPYSDLVEEILGQLLDTAVILGYSLDDEGLYAALDIESGRIVAQMID